MEQHMKNYLVLGFTLLLLTGCITVTKNKPETRTLKLNGVNTVENSKVIQRTITRGQLLCEAGQKCPELAIDWQKNKGEYALSLHSYDQQQLDMSEISFVIDGKVLSYPAIGQTNYRRLDNSNVIDSSNTVMIPDAVLKQFRDAKNIAVIMNTNQGEIAHYMLKNQKSSDAYRLFLRAYS